MAFEELPLQEHFSWHPALRFLDPLLTADRLHALGRFLRLLTKTNRRAGPVVAPRENTIVVRAILENVDPDYPNPENPHVQEGTRTPRAADHRP
jgi:hypothetical protein